jgi:serine acetyltransferase
VEPVLSPPAPRTLPPIVREAPPPLRGGPLGLLRWLRTHGMLDHRYARLALRWLWLKARWRGRLVTDGLCFVAPGVQFEIGRDARVVLGRWSWIGHGTKSVLGQECTISCYQHVSIGRECVVADRAMLIDFDHGVVETDRPIREQGIYKRDVRIGHNVWVGYGASFLRGVTVGDNCVVGTYAVVAGVPARVLRMRPAPKRLRWG